MTMAAQQHENQWRRNHRSMADGSVDHHVMKQQANREAIKAGIINGEPDGSDDRPRDQWAW